MKEIVDVVVIADASGSMGPFRRETVNGMYRVIEEQKQYENTRITIATFKKQDFKMLLNMCDLDEFTPDHKFIEKKYRIGGMTPLYKCSIEIMEKLENNIKDTPLSMRPSKVACTIITDGYDNASQPYTVQDFNKKIKKLEKNGWRFAYVGMGEAAQLQAKATAVKTSYSVDANAKGVRDSYRSVSNFASIVRSE